MNVRFTQNASRQVFAIVRHYAELDRDLGRCLIDQIDEFACGKPKDGLSSHERIPAGATAPVPLCHLLPH